MTDMDDLLNSLGKVEMDKIPLPRKQEIEKMINFLDDIEDELNNWEQEFLYDITVRHTKDQGISDNQFNKLCEVYAKYL